MTDEELAAALVEAATGPAREIMLEAADRLRGRSQAEKARSPAPYPKGLPELMTPEHVAAWLHTTRKEVYNMVSRGQLPKSAQLRIGSRLLFDLSKLKEWLRESERR